MLKKIIIGLILIITLFLFCKDILIKIYLVHYLKSVLGGTCSIEKLHADLNGAEITNLSLHGKSLDLNLKELQLTLDLSKITNPAVSRIALDTAVLKIRDLKNISGILSAQNKNIAKAKKNKAIAIPGLMLDFRNISLTLEQDKSVKSDIHFSLKCNIRGNAFVIDSVEIYDANVTSGDFAANHFILRKLNRDLYRMAVKNLRIKEKEFSAIMLPVKIKTGKVFFPKAKNTFFGDKAYTSAALTFKGKDLLFNANLEDASFENILAIAGPDSANIGGLFDGKISLSFSGSSLKDLKVNFSNKDGGRITIPKETSFDFLKNYLDAPSYKALVDNLKNYDYNIGEISITKEKDTLGIRIDFSSEKMGRRNITINIHNE